MIDFTNRSANLLTMAVAASFLIQNNVYAQATPDLRGPIDSPNASTSTAAAAQGATSTTPASPTSTAKPKLPAGNLSNTVVPPVTPVPPLPPTNMEAHTDISIPLNMNDATKGLLLNTTNPNQKPPKPPEPLKAVITNVEFSTGRREVLLGAYRGLEVKVVNGTDRPLVFNGDAAVMQFNNESARAITLRQVDQVSDPQQTTRDKVIAVLKAGITIGLLPAIKDEAIQKGPILQRYGSDERRREDEQSRFGKRILWPGDSSEGIVYFETDHSLHGGTLELPVCSLGDLQDRSSLSGVSQSSGQVPLEPRTEGEAGAPPANMSPSPLPTSLPAVKPTTKKTNAKKPSAPKRKKEGH